MQLWNIEAARAAPSLLTHEAISYSGMPMSLEHMSRRERYLGAEAEAPMEVLMNAILAERRGGNMTFPVEIYLTSQRGSLMMIGDALPLVLTHEKALPMVRHSRVFWEEFLISERLLNEEPFEQVLSFENSASLENWRGSNVGRMRDGLITALAHECCAWLTEPISFDRKQFPGVGATSQLLSLTLRTSDSEPWGRQDVVAARKELDNLYAKREEQALTMFGLLGGSASMVALPPHPARYQIMEAREALGNAFVSMAQRDNALAEALEISKAVAPVSALAKKNARI